jgi:citrate synthase
MLKMQVWWRAESLNGHEESLLNALFEAHYQSAFRQNASTVAVVNASDASGEVSKAIVAGIMSLGGKHAPLEKTYEFLSLLSPSEAIGPMVAAGGKIPGWGGTFQKDQPDPIWDKTASGLAENNPDLADQLRADTQELSKYGVNVYPNPSAYTAAVAITLQMPKKLLNYLFIASRIHAWAQIAAKQIPGE